MSRGITKTMTVIFVLISVLLLVAPGVFSNTFVQIDDVGLKGMQVRADVFKEGQISNHGPKHGRIQVIVREVETELYSFKFLVDLKKASPNTEYGVHVWADLPDFEFTIHGDNSGTWKMLELFAGLPQIGIDLEPNDNTIIRTTLGLLGATKETIKHDTGMTIMTDNRGTYKNIKTGIATEDALMEYALDLIWPFLREQIVLAYPSLALFLPAEMDFASLHIIGVTMPEQYHKISGGFKFIGPGGPEGDDNYVTETITVERLWKEFEWWA